MKNCFLGRKRWFYNVSKKSFINILVAVIVILQVLLGLGGARLRSLLLWSWWGRLSSGCLRCRGEGWRADVEWVREESCLGEVLVLEQDRAAVATLCVKGERLNLDRVDGGGTCGDRARRVDVHARNEGDGVPVHRLDLLLLQNLKVSERNTLKDIIN